MAFWVGVAAAYDVVKSSLHDEWFAFLSEPDVFDSLKKN